MNTRNRLLKSIFRFLYSLISNKSTLIFIPLLLTSFTHLLNPIGFPSLNIDEGHYLRKAISTLEGEDLQPQDRYFAPYFGQIFIVGFFEIVGYPNSINPSPDLNSIEMLYLVPRLLMSILAIVDTFLIFKISERRYGFKIALVASILFAIMPYTWMIRRIFLESIQLPFLLASILLPLYLKKDITRYRSSINDDGDSNTNINLRTENHSDSFFTKRNILLILLSGSFLGLSIFTKIPIFAMIPLVGYLVVSNTHSIKNGKLKSLGLWFIPVILIPLIWPIHAYSIGEFDKWFEDVLYQTQRESKPLVNSLYGFLERDSILFVLGFAGIFYAAVKRDLFILLFSIPFLSFLYWLDFVSSFHLIPLFPVFSIASAKLIFDLSFLIPNVRIQKILPYGIIFAIGILGLVSTFAIISIDVNSVILKTQVLLIQHLQKSNESVTVIGNPLYIWIPRYIYNLEYYEKSLFSIKSVKTENYIIIDDSLYKKIKKKNDKIGMFHQSLYLNTHLIKSIDINDQQTKKQYNLNLYPFLKVNPKPDRIDIRANY